MKNKKNGAREKLKFPGLLFPDGSIKPSCPRCGSRHIQSRGVDWGCCDCGRRWAKKKNWGKNYEKEKVD